ncbi:MAG: hypothetical protein JWL63_633 [Rhodocyclales bacterium]|nr:hypothetical protein [Rhodocyclales bacterium]
MKARIKVFLGGMSAFFLCGFAHATQNFYLNSFAEAKSDFTSFRTTNYDTWSTTPLYQVFRDDFSDGNAPPSAPNFVSGAAGSYVVKGAFLPGAEQSGYALLNPYTEGAASDNAAGISYMTLYGLLPSNIAPGSTLGLRLSSTFATEARYQFAVPDNDVSYGIRLSDQNGTGNKDDFLDLRLRTLADGTTQFAMIDQDFTAGTSTVVGTKAFVPPTGVAEISFLMLHSIIGSNTVDGFYRYYDGAGVAMGDWTKVGSSDLFHGENFTQASFIASGLAAPEPASVLLLFAGLGVLGMARLRRK